MMNKENKNLFGNTGCLSMEQMMDYVHDRLSMKGRNKVERHLQECEFCSEAMEGFLLTEGKEEKVRSAIAEINQSVTGKVADTKIRWMIAASFALAVLAGGIAYMNSELKPGSTGSDVAAVSKNKDTTVKLAAPEQISGDFKYKDSISFNNEGKDKGYEEKLSFSSGERKGLLEKNETISDGYFPPSEIKKSEEQMVVAPSPEINSTVSGGTLMYDSIVPVPNASRITDMKEAEKLKELSKSPVKEDKIAYNYSNQKNARTKKKSAIEYRSAGKMADAEEISLDDAGEKADKKEEGKTVKDGIDKYNAKNYKEATLILEEILKTDPASDEALYYNGLSYYELKNYDQAILNFDRIKKGSKYWEDALQMKAKTYLAKGDKEKAKEATQQLIDTGGKYKDWAEKAMKEY